MTSRCPEDVNKRYGEEPYKLKTRERQSQLAKWSLTPKKKTRWSLMLHEEERRRMAEEKNLNLELEGCDATDIT
jgi:hypothetical protein